MKRITIKAAKCIADQFDKDQVIILAFSKKDGKTWVTTYGRTVEDCEQAAIGGNRLKRAMGWPEDECEAMPPRAICKCGHANKYHKHSRCEFYNADSDGKTVFACICTKFDLSSNI